MNLRELRTRLDELEAECGTDKVKVGIWPESREPIGIESIQLATYRDPGEVNHVFWFHPGKF